MNKTLMGLVAAAGMLGCARDVPVYSPRPEVVQEVPGVGGMYKSVWSDAEQLKLSWYMQKADGTIGSMDFSWSRYEPRDSAQCLKERLNGKARFDEPDYGIVGWVELSMENAGCDAVVDSCSGTYTPDNGNQVDISADVCGSPDQDFADFKGFVNTQLFNIDNEVNAWHNRKGL